MRFSTITAAAGFASVASAFAMNTTTTAYTTTYCSESTTITWGSSTITVSSATTLTLPCTTTAAMTPPAPYPSAGFTSSWAPAASGTVPGSSPSSQPSPIVPANDAMGRSSSGVAGLVALLGLAVAL